MTLTILERKRTGHVQKQRWGRAVKSRRHNTYICLTQLILSATFLPKFYFLLKCLVRFKYVESREMVLLKLFAGQKWRCRWRVRTCRYGGVSYLSLVNIQCTCVCACVFVMMSKVYPGGSTLENPTVTHHTDTLRRKNELSQQMQENIL